MADRFDDISCYSAQLLIRYARAHDIPDDVLFDGIEIERESLENPLEWTDVRTWSQLALNLTSALGDEPGLLEKIAEQITIEDAGSFQLAFLRVAPLAEIVRRAGHHVKTTINRNLAARVELGPKGVADIYMCPVDPSRYSQELCDYSRGTLLAIMRQKGYVDPQLEELECSLHEGVNECHYRLRWKPSASLLSRMRSFFLEYHSQRVLIDHLEERFRQLRRQYEDVRRVQSALKRSETRFKAIFENIVDVYFEATQDGRVLEISPSVETLTGRSPTELYGMFLSTMFTESSNWDGLFEALKRDSRLSDHEIEISHKDGRGLICSINAVLMRDTENKPYKASGTIRDITARKQNERVLRESAERQRLIVQNMPVMLAAFDEDERIIAWNQECVNVSGYASADMMERADALDVLFPLENDRQRFNELLRPGSHGVRNIELVLTCRDGARRTVLVSNLSSELPIPGWHAWVVAFDISERMRAEQAVRESEARFRQLAGNIDEMFWLASPDMREILYVSPAVDRVWGVDCDSVLANPALLLTAVDPEDLEQVREFFSAPLRAPAGNDIALQFRLRGPDSVVRWISAWLYPVHDESGAVVRVAGIASDITAERTAAQDRRVMEEQLHQAQKMDAIGQLAGGIAHDFNNQLAGIMGFAELLKDEVGTDTKLAGYVDYILVGSRRAAELTAKLLAFARKGKYQTVSLNVHRVISEVVSLLEHSIDKRIHIVQTLAASPPTTMGDPSQIQNAILNLGLNARDAMPQGGELTFATENVELDAAFCRTLSSEITPGRYIRISVTDTGVGMTDEVKKRVFEPFFTTKNEGKGTGMGLASVYGTVRNHHGAIAFDSRLGKGTQFNVYLPLEESQGETKATPAARTVRGTATVLVVDDEETFRDMAVATLTSLGYRAVACPDGVAAVEYYRHSAGNVDLVILDMIMPQLDGPETFKRIREINPKAKVLLCSGYSVDGRAQDLLKDGASGFIEKPFRKADISQKLAEILAVQG